MATWTACKLTSKILFPGNSGKQEREQTFLFLSGNKLNPVGTMGTKGNKQGEQKYKSAIVSLLSRTMSLRGEQSRVPAPRKKTRREEVQYDSKKQSAN